MDLRFPPAWGKLAQETSGHFCLVAFTWRQTKIFTPLRGIYRLTRAKCDQKYLRRLGFEQIRLKERPVLEQLSQKHVYTPKIRKYGLGYARLGFPLSLITH
jgi:hypothetical protein